MSEKSEYYGAEKTAEVCVIWPASAANQMGKMVEQCKITDNILATNGNIQGNATIPRRSGFVAEEFHAETFNLESILQNKKSKAWTGNYENSPVSNNNQITDIAITNGNGDVVVEIQSKYCGTPEKTATALRELNPDGTAKYVTNDQYLVPADKVDETIGAARRTKQSQQNNRPLVADAAEQVEKKATGTISHDGVNSKPLTTKEAYKITKEANNGKNTTRKEIQRGYKNQSTLQQTSKAAGSAAVVTSVICGTINAVHFLNKVKKGEMSTEDAFVAIMKNTAIAAGDSAVKAAAATAAVSTAVRFFPELIKGSMFKTSLTTGAVAGAAICAADLVQCLVLVAAGKMTMAQLEERTGKNIFQTGAGVLGSSIGAVLGAPGGPIGVAIGAMVGGMITSVTMTMAIENHIDKPYREILANTQSLVQSQQIMNTALQKLATSEAAFESFVIECQKSERQFDQQMNMVNQQMVSVNATGREMWKRINNI